MNFFRIAWTERSAGGDVCDGSGTELAVKRPATREARADWLHRFCARAMRGWGSRSRCSGRFPERGAVISNHLSYLDIVVFAAAASVRVCVEGGDSEVAGGGMDDDDVGDGLCRAWTWRVGDEGEAGDAGGGGCGTASGVFSGGHDENGSGLLKFHSGLLAQAHGWRRARDGGLYSLLV